MIAGNINGQNLRCEETFGRPRGDLSLDQLLSIT